MDMTFSTEEQNFRAEVRAWIQANLPEEWKTSKICPMAEIDDHNREWDKIIYRSGLACITWPKEYGGREASLIEELILLEELAWHEAPTGLLHGRRLVAPTLFAHGTEEQKKKHLPPIVRGDIIWCQGFSEPNAGSDLADLQSKAVVDGDFLVINGQKIWTTWAYMADWCFAMVRTSKDGPKHRGITYVLIDLKTPGIIIRPIRQITGDSEFCEVFFENVRVPLENVVGEINRGWYVAMTTLNNERGTAFIDLAIRIRRHLDRLAELARNTQRNGRPVSEDPVFRQKLARLHIETEASQHSVHRTLSSLIRGEPLGPEAAMIKLCMSEVFQRITELALEIEGSLGQLVYGSNWTVNNGEWQNLYLYQRSFTIAGGTSDIQRNILGESVLGLPR